MQETLYIGREGLGAGRFFSPGFWVDAIAGDVRALWASRHVLANLVKTQLVTRYHRSSLGFLWTLLHPLLLLSVQAVVFSQIFQMRLAEFVVYLFAGMVAWQFLASGIDLGSRALISHEGLLRKVPIPKFVCVLAEILGGAINLMFATVAILVILFAVEFVTGTTAPPVAPAAGTPAAEVAPPATPADAPAGGKGRFAGGVGGVGHGITLHPQLVIFPAAVVLLGVFLFGTALLGMSLVIWFRDFEHMIAIVMTALYFTVPIVYPRSLVPPDLMYYMQLNPLYHYVTLFHHALALGTWPEVVNWQWAVGSAVVVLVAGYVTYKVLEDDYIYRL